MVIRDIDLGESPAVVAATPSSYMSPAERLAQSLIAQKAKDKPQTHAAVVDSPVKADNFGELTLSPGTVPDLSPRLVRNSIKEVTNAIVHYCSESEDDKLVSPSNDSSSNTVKPPVPARRSTLTSPTPTSSPPDVEPPPVPRRSRPERKVVREPSDASRSKSPRVWMESSFVGIKPIISPKTPDGDVTGLFDGNAVLLNGLNSQSDEDHTPDLMPIAKLRTGTTHLETYFGKKDLQQPTAAVGNGEFWMH
jgi:hypothetical protein